MRNTRKKSKIAEAEELGYDLTLLYNNLNRTPTERLQNLESWIALYDELKRAKPVRKTAGDDAVDRKNSESPE
jgi:hypothetical protein